VANLQSGFIPFKARGNPPDKDLAIFVQQFSQKLSYLRVTMPMGTLAVEMLAHAVRGVVGLHCGGYEEHGLCGSYVAYLMRIILP
jgi:hypothetical protein